MEYSFAFGREHSSQRRNMLALVMFDRLELAGGQGGVKCCGSGAATSGIGAVRPKVSTSADTALRLLTPPCQRRTHRTHGCAPLKRRRHSPARSTCATAPVLRSSPLGADMVGKSRNMSADMLFTPGLLALMPPTICCVRLQSVRDFVTEISGGATPAPVRCGSEL